MSIAPSSGYRFKGRGFGHGVGLCVIGAGRRASKGATAEEILKFYFPGLTIGSGASPMPTTAAAAAPPRKVDAAAAADVALALPGAEENERQVVLSLIRRSRDEIATAAGIAAPARIRVTVHPSVESFGRATGQPWWVSGATDGAAIESAAVTILRQQGQLDRTIRHEVTHALLDATLAKRPMWVREGAAAYFASRASRDRRSRRASTVRATRNCFVLFPPARSARPTRARKRVSRAQSPKASGGIRFAERVRSAATPIDWRDRRTRDAS